MGDFVGLAGSVPKGVRVTPGSDESVHLDLPTIHERSCPTAVVPAVLGTAFCFGGLVIIFSGAWQGVIFAGVGVVFAWLGYYFVWGRVQIRLLPDRVEWNRRFVIRWTTRVIARHDVKAIGTRGIIGQGSRTVGWGLYVQTPARRRSIPGIHNQRRFRWLRRLLAEWSGAPLIR